MPQGLLPPNSHHLAMLGTPGVPRCLAGRPRPLRGPAAPSYQGQSDKQGVAPGSRSSNKSFPQGTGDTGKQPLDGTILTLGGSPP